MHLRSLRAVVVALAFASLVGCGGDDADPGGGGGGGHDATSSSGGRASSTSASGGGKACDTDPLRTGLTAQQTGVSVDAFDCQVQTFAAAYAEPDPMIFKAIMYVESRFDQLSVACPNLPCGTPDGWTTDESGCYGLMQIVPACGGLPHDAGLQPDGHPDLETDMSAADWAGSIFNPDVNVEVGIAGISGNRAQVVAQFPGCTEEQYTLMAVGNYNSYGSTQSCTVYNTDYDDIVLDAYRQYAAAARYTPHAY